MTATIQMTGHGTSGQWGNQLYTYSFVRTYAKRFEINYELPPWAGQVFFGHKDPPITDILPDHRERYEPYPWEPCFGTPIPPKGTEYHDRNFIGWAQYHGSWYAPDKEFIQGLFKATPGVAGLHDPYIEKLRSMGDTIISLHLRRGDSGRMIYALTPVIWCLRWLKENWKRYSNPVLFLATESVELKRWFKQYGVVTAEDLGVQFTAHPPALYKYPYDIGDHRARQLTFFPDWYIMQHSDVVVGSESTFSASAAWLNPTIQEYWRPRLSLQGFEKCDLWNEHVSPREHLNDYPFIPGTQIDSNPAFAPHWKGFKPKYASVPETDDMISSWIESNPRD